METTHWNCPNCNEVVELTFENCWNCASDKAGNLDPQTQQEHTQIKNKIRVNADIYSAELVLVNRWHLLHCSKSIKNIVYLSIIQVVFLLGSWVVMSETRNVERIKFLIIFAVLTVLVCYVWMLLSIFSAGNHLENAVKKQEMN